MLKNSSAFMPLIFVIVAVSTLGLFKLNMHLGKPHRFYRGFNNLRLSPVSREIAGVSMFYTGLLGYVVFGLFDNACHAIYCQHLCFYWRVEWCYRLVLHVQAVPYPRAAVLESLANRHCIFRHDAQFWRVD